MIVHFRMYFFFLVFKNTPAMPRQQTDRQAKTTVYRILLLLTSSNSFVCSLLCRNRGNRKHRGLGLMQR
uniref:Putative secreted peptide n=1 Tax=Anopheles braziliensis TaxID=58242 RepID=A0A2M3ZTA0_9DIPT